MSIPYVLHKNHLTDDPEDHMAVIQYYDTVDHQRVIERMIERGSTTTKPDILAVLDEYYDAIESLVLEGFKVTTPGANYGISIKGVFNGSDDNLDRSRHTIEPSVTSGKQYRQTIRVRAKSHKEEALKPSPNIRNYIDISSGEYNSILTPGGIGRITGHRLKFDGDDPNQGIFFIATDGSPMRVDQVGHNKPGALMFIVPNTLTQGEYTLEVRSLFGKQDIRSGILEELLSVS